VQSCIPWACLGLHSNRPRRHEDDHGSQQPHLEPSRPGYPRLTLQIGPANAAEETIDLHFNEGTAGCYVLGNKCACEERGWSGDKILKEMPIGMKKNGGLVGGFLGRHQRLAQHCVVEGLPKQVQES
jgi:hypothetical protein